MIQLGAVFAITQMTHAFGANGADALFLIRIGVNDLPLMIALSGAAVMIVTLLHGVGLSRYGSGRWLWAAALGAGSWAGLAWASTGLGQTWALAVIWISTQAIIWMTFTVMWNAAEAACDTRQAKRLFPLFAAAGIFGGVAGNLLSGPVAVFLGAEQLLGVQAVLLMLSSFLLRRSRPLFVEEAGDGSTSIKGDLRAAFLAVRSSRLLSLAAVAAFLISILFFLVVFPFNQAVATAFASEAEVAGFLGVFSSIAAGATFLVSLLITKRVFAAWGVVVALALLPLVYLAGFGVWLVSFSLVTATLFRGLQWVAVNAIGSTAYPALFNVLSGRRRGQVMTFMTAGPAQIGTIVVGFALLIGASTARPVRFAVGLVVSLLLLVIVMAMRPAYNNAVMSAVKQGLLGVLAVPQRGLVSPVDGEVSRALMDHLADDRPENRALAVAAIARAEIESAADHIEPLLTDESPRVRGMALESLFRLDPNRILPRVESVIADSAWEVRLKVLQLMGESGGETYRGLAAGALQDRHPQVAVTAAALVGGERGADVVAELLRSQDPGALRAVLDEVCRSGGSLLVDPTPYLDHPDRQVRAAAAAAYRFWNDDARLLLPGLDDPSMQVRRASAVSLVQLPGNGEIINEVLATGSVNATDAVLRAIAPAEEIAPPVIQWAAQEARRASRLRSWRAALGTDLPSLSIEYLAKVLATRAQRLEQWVVLAITTTGIREAMPIVERGLRSTDPETRAQAVEALEMTGDRKALAVLLPLLESPTPDGGPDARSALRELLEDFDPWLRALATRSLAAEITDDLDRLQKRADQDHAPIVRLALQFLPNVTSERFDVLNAVDKVIALHRVPMFSELDPEDLELIAKATAEVRYPAHEPIYHDGDEAREMLVIVEGKAVVSRTHASTFELIETYGPGEHVGELALLGGGRRSADVTAGEEGLHGLVITKDDLLSILEERPAVALGMLTTLAQRLAHQTTDRA